jgi:polysaccharide biosynthesis transport protein
MNSNELWQILKRRWLPATLAAGTLLSVGSLYNFWQKPLYEARGKILFKEQQSILTSGVNATNTNTPATMLRSNTVAQQAVIAAGSNKSSNQVSDNIKVGSVSPNNQIEVTYRDADPPQAVKILQQVMEAYLQQDLALRRKNLQQNRGQLEQQLPAATSNLKVAQANFTKFKEDFKVVDVTAEKATLVNALKYLEQEISTSKEQLASLQPDLQKLQDTFGRDAMLTLRSSITNESAGMRKLIAALQVVEQQLAYQRTKAKEEDATVQELKEKQGLIKTEMQAESQRTMVNSIQFRGKLVQWQQTNVKQDAIARMMVLETKRDALERVITSLGEIQKSGQDRQKLFPQLEEKFNALKQILDTATTNYNQISGQLNTNASDLTEIGKIVSPVTVGKKPIDNGNALPPLLVLLGSLLAGGGLAYGLDRADRRLKSVAAVQKELDYLLLGSVPQLRIAAKDSPQLILSDREAGEPFRLLYANLADLNERSPAQVILISSALKGEGKSTIAANLAIATAEQQQRVLLIDANLQEPGQHRIWGVDNSSGLSNVLQEEAQFAESVVEVAANLQLLTAGTLHHNPVSLFSSPVMVEMITQWFGLYDLVVIDASALSQGTEAMLLAKMADGLVLVVHPDTTEAIDLQKAQKTLEQAQQRVLGMVVNGIAVHEQLLPQALAEPEPVPVGAAVDSDDMFVPRPIDQ